MIRISLESIAAKLQWLRSQGSESMDKLLDTPRFVEALCFLQAASQQPGGLQKFCTEFLAASPKWVASVTKARPQLEEWERFPNWERFPEMIKRWCEEPSIDCIGDFVFTEFGPSFPGFVEAVAVFADAYAETEMQKTADTSLRKTVISELDFARTSTVPMVLVADTRHGKTTAIETYCRAWPGRARLITVPDGQHEREFYAAFAEAFGIAVMPSVATRTIKDRVEYTLRHTGLFSVLDEAHYVLPHNYTKTTPPQRLNWVRAQIIDRHLPCALSCTPQSQQESLARYAQRTHYNLEQWVGRMPKPVLISDKPSYDDLVAVAKARFGDFPQVVIDELCDAADGKIGACKSRTTGETGFKIIELAGARARFLAAQRERKVTLADIREAVLWAGAPAGPTPPGSDFSETKTGVRRECRHAGAEPSHGARAGGIRAPVSVEEVPA
jgi:hypothetical protein